MAAITTYEDELAENVRRLTEIYRERANQKIYLVSAFHSTRAEVFMFIKYYYFVIRYDPGASPKDSLVYGPYFLSHGFPKLDGTGFQESRVDAAFGCHGVNQAFLFHMGCCAKIWYDPDTRRGDVEWPIKNTIEMFPFLEGSIFEDAVDAAFKSPVVGQAYLFKDSKYALIDYSEGSLINFGLITDLFPCLINTIFATKIGAAFASNSYHEVCLFNNNNFVRVCFLPPNCSHIIEGPSDTNWPSFEGIVPQDSRALECVGDPIQCLGPRFCGGDVKGASVRGDAKTASTKKHKCGGNEGGTSVCGDANSPRKKKRTFVNDRGISIAIDPTRDHEVSIYTIWPEDEKDVVWVMPKKPKNKKQKMPIS